MDGDKEREPLYYKLQPTTHELTTYIEWGSKHDSEEVEGLRQLLGDMMAEQGLEGAIVEIEVEPPKNQELRLRCFITVEETDIVAMDALHQALVRALPVVGTTLITDVSLRTANLGDMAELQQQHEARADEVAQAIEIHRRSRPPVVSIGSIATSLVTHEQ